MSERRLRAVSDDDVASRPVPPRSLLEAADRDRRTWLVKQRAIIAKQIDGGVPAHALGRLIATVNEIDAEIRQIDATDDEEARRAAGSTERRSFDAAAI